MLRSTGALSSFAAATAMSSRVAALTSSGNVSTRLLLAGVGTSATLTQSDILVAPTVSFSYTAPATSVDVLADTAAGWANTLLGEVANNNFDGTLRDFAGLTTMAWAVTPTPIITSQQIISSPPPAPFQMPSAPRAPSPPANPPTQPFGNIPISVRLFSPPPPPLAPEGLLDKVTGSLTEANMGITIGIVVGGVALLALAAGVWVYIKRRQRALQRMRLPDTPIPSMSGTSRAFQLKMFAGGEDGEDGPCRENVLGGLCSPTSGWAWLFSQPGWWGNAAAAQEGDGDDRRAQRQSTTEGRLRTALRQGKWGRRDALQQEASQPPRERTGDGWGDGRL